MDYLGLSAIVCSNVSAMARLPAEQFQCKIDVELDIPYSKVSVCRPLRLEATVGVHKLHIQSNIKVSDIPYS